MCFDVVTFKFIIGSGFGERWLLRPIPHSDAHTGTLAKPCPGERLLDTDGALGLALHFLNSTMLESSLQQLFGLIPSTVSYYITFSLKILLETLRQMPDAVIQWPGTLEEFQSYSSIITAHHPQLHGAFVLIDGLNLMTETSDDVDIENATFNGWLSEHFISSIIVFALDGMTFCYIYYRLSDQFFRDNHLC